MSDLFESLREDVEDPRSPLPASEVRRRGDRLARRRTTVPMAGAAALVTVIALGGAVLLGGPEDRTSGDNPAASGRGPTPRPAAAYSRVPADFPLEQGLERSETVTGPDRQTSFLPEVMTCRNSTATATGDLDRVTVTSTGPEFFSGRDLGLYRTPTAAAAAVRALVRSFEGCPEFSRDGGDSTAVTAVEQNADGELGEQSWTITRGYRTTGTPALGQEVLVVSRTGYAVLVSRTADAGAGLTDIQGMAEDVQRQETALTPVTGAMCMFAKWGCTGVDIDHGIDPQGYGALKLGLSAEEVVASGAATLGPDEGGACRTLTYPGRPEGEVDGFVSERRGVAVLFAHAGLRTTDGLAIGSTASQVRDALPEVSSAQVGLEAAVPGGRWVFGMADGVVEQLSLEIDGQDCVG